MYNLETVTKYSINTQADTINWIKINLKVLATIKCRQKKYMSVNTINTKLKHKLDQNIITTI